jgi:shikimate 5-dehydrogenase
VTAICSHLNAAAVTISTFNFHGYGTGGAAEAVGNTTLTTELTTEYVVNSTRPTGSQGASTNTYTTVGTLSPDSGGTIAITEHGIFSASSAGTLLDRSLFSAVNLVASADSLQTTYILTLPAGS